MIEDIGETSGLHRQHWLNVAMRKFEFRETTSTLVDSVYTTMLASFEVFKFQVLTRNARELCFV